MASFLSGSNGEKNSKSIKFENSIISVRKGDKFVYEVVKDYFKQVSPIEPKLEGRLFITNVTGIASKFSVASKSILLTFSVILKVFI